MSRIPIPAPRRALLATVAVACIAGCGDATAPAPSALSPQARAFVASQPVAQPQPAAVSYVDPAGSVVVFTLSYGPAQDCMSGCFYSQAYGLQLGARVGWVAPPVGAGPYVTFDVQPTDTALFAPAFLSGLQSARPSVYAAVAALLACDADTPVALRRSLAAQGATRGVAGCAPLP